jgi:methionyl-tRNA synthetase
VIISRFETATFADTFGIQMAAAGVPGPASSWGRVPVGGHSSPDRHDEIEVLVFVRGRGTVAVDGRRAPVDPGTVVVLQPFERHVIENAGPDELVFFSLYWRDAGRAQQAAGRHGQGFGQRPVFVFSTPPTPNGDLHLGHLSGPYLGADAYTRFQRMNGARAWHITGSDDYQSYVVECARREGRSPAETAADYSARIRQALRLLDVEVDQFTATDQDEDYRVGLQDFFARLVASGRVTSRSAPALLDADSGEYLYEVGVSGGCPGCGAVTNGNICEDCGEPNVVTDLADPVARASARPPVVGRAERYMLPLHEFQDLVAAHQKGARTPGRLRELADRVFARDRLDLPITQLGGWGVPPAGPEADGQVIWVWPEMAYGFLHGIERLAAGAGQDWRAAEPGADWKVVHFFGYDNSFYHSLLYPVLYHLAWPGWNPDVDYHLNEFYLLEGEKFSTSRRHAIWGTQILSAATVDGVRFHLARTRPEGVRTNFTLAQYRSSVTDVLIGSWQEWLRDLGARVRDGYGALAPDAGTWTPEHTAMLGRLAGHLNALTGHLGPAGFSLRAAAAELEALVDDARAFAAAESASARSPRWSSETRTAVALELAAARLLATCSAPVMPRFAADLSGRLGLPEPDRWPEVVQLLPAGSSVDLAGADLFAPPPGDAEIGTEAPVRPGGASIRKAPSHV